jgi:hypothetical protein
MGILRMLQRRKIPKAFQDHLSPDVIVKVLRETGSEIRPPEVQHFQFVVALADDAKPQEVPEMVSEVIGTLIQHRATVSDISSSLVVALVGVPFPEGNSPEARLELVDALLRVNGERIRIAPSPQSESAQPPCRPAALIYGCVPAGHDCLPCQTV